MQEWIYPFKNRKIVANFKKIVWHLFCNIGECSMLISSSCIDSRNVICNYWGGCKDEGEMFDHVSATDNNNMLGTERYELF